MKNIYFTIATVFFICMIAFFVVCTVKGQERGADAEKEVYYREMEKKLLEDTKGYLRELGFADSGVTLNRIVDSEENREYTFTIHHSRIDRMDEAQRNSLLQQLSEREIISPGDNAAIQYRLLTLEDF